MIPDNVIVAVEIVGAAGAVAVIVRLLVRPRLLSGAARGLLLAVGALTLVWASFNIVEWAGAFPKADIAEDFFEPLLPVVWLFLFVIVPEQEAQRRLRRSVDRLAALHRLAVDLAIANNPQAIMDEVVTQAAHLLDLPVVVILTEENADGRLVARAAYGLDLDEADGLTLDPGRSLSSDALQHRAPVQAGLADREIPEQTAAIARRHGLTHVIAVPLLVEDHAVGVLGAGRAGGRRFDAGEVRLLQTLCGHAAGAIHSAMLLRRVTESEARYRAIVENAGSAIIVVDAYRHVLFWNRGAERLFGWTAEEVDGHHVEFIYPEDRRAEVVREILPALQRQGTWFGEFPCVRKSGERFTAFLNLSRVFDASGSVICTLGILSDVTERVRLREQLFQAQKMETLGTLAGGIAHDFNNLLTAILGATALLRDALPEGSEDYESVLSIEQAARRGTDLVGQLLSLSRREPTRTEPLDLNRIVEEAVALLQRTFPPRVQIVTDLAPHLPAVRGDPGQIHQVLMNLAVNARDAMDGEGTFTIRTARAPARGGEMFTGAASGPGVILTVSDTGCGISPDQQDRIFEPFVTTKGEEGGTGLGLSTAYAIVTRHGGRISVESIPGGGTTFHVFLPAG
jgi:PAS domain S-box-containing protein